MFFAAVETILANRKKCGGVEYNYGSWVESHQTATIPTQSFECCDGKNADQESETCKKIGVRQNWTDYPTVFNHHGCDCRSKFMTQIGRKNITYHISSADYHWRPDTCKLTHWDAYSFCNLTEGKKILLIGDSTMLQSKLTLQSMIHQTNTSDIYLWECQKRITFMMSDYLLSFPTQASGQRGRGKSLLHLVTDEVFAGRFYDIIMFSLGFHIVSKVKYEEYNLNVSDHSIGGYMVPRILEQIDMIRDLYSERGKPAPLMVYKTDNVPHHNCKPASGYDLSNKTLFNFLKTDKKIHFQTENQNQPDHSLANRSNLVGWNSKALFNWNVNFIMQDHFVHAISNADILIFRMYPLYSRIDGHPGNGDCLHYCAPGPVDIFSRLLHHLVTIGKDEWNKDKNMTDIW